MCFSLNYTAANYTAANYTAAHRYYSSDDSSKISSSSNNNKMLKRPKMLDTIGCKELLKIVLWSRQLMQLHQPQ